MPEVYDFGGYVTKTDLLCSDGRVIKRDAFVDCDGQKVPLVWGHRRDDLTNVLGHTLLENRSDGVYGYCSFNQTEMGQNAKMLVEHGDITALSIYANQLKHRGNEVVHGLIREVSLVCAGANPGAIIDQLCIAHSDGCPEELDDEADIMLPWAPEANPSFQHSELEVQPQNESKSSEEIAHKEDAAVADSNTKKEKTIGEIFDTLTDEQKEAVYAIVDMILNEDDDDTDDAEHEDQDEEEDTYMKHNVFENDTPENSLSHEDQMEIFKDAKKYGSLKDSCLEHGITNLEILFPEAKAIRPTPDFITRDQGWVADVFGGTNKTPFSRIKSMSANLTEDEARAKGYIKGNKKTDEQFSLLKRVTTPQTIYKKQSLDRDDVIDIVDMDVVAWMKAEMRMMLNEEIARAILVGDGRLASSEDKINPLNIRPIYGDDPMYTIYQTVDQSMTDKTEKANAIIDAAHYARIDYKGSGSPTFYCTSRTLTNLLLARDKIGHRIYPTVSELASAMRVSKIVEVPVMENLTREYKVEGESNVTMYDLLGVIVNPRDYTVGADRGGAVSMFDDFDINYNKMQYLIETRCSGALTLPYSAIVLETPHVASVAG